MWLSHTQKLFFPHSCACQHLHCPYFFGAKCFHFGLLWCAEMINRLMTLRLPEENKKNYRLEDTGNVTHHSVLLGDKLHTFSYAPTNIWQYFKALHKASRMNTWYVCLFVCFLNEQSSNLSPSLNPFCLEHRVGTSPCWDRDTFSSPSSGN